MGKYNDNPINDEISASSYLTALVNKINSKKVKITLEDMLRVGEAKL